MNRKSSSRAVAAAVSVGELKDRLSEYLRAVEAGRTITVVSHHRAVARLAPLAEPASTRARALPSQVQSESSQLSWAA